MLDCLSIIERYYTPGNDDYRVLVHHSRQVADLAVALTQRLIEQGVPMDIEFVEEAAMLHDIGMCRTDAPGICCHGTEPYILHGVLGRRMLDSLGLYRHGRVCERHTCPSLHRATSCPRALRRRSSAMPTSSFPRAGSMRAPRRWNVPASRWPSLAVTPCSALTRWLLCSGHPTASETAAVESYTAKNRRTSRAAVSC